MKIKFGFAAIVILLFAMALNACAQEAQVLNGVCAFTALDKKGLSRLNDGSDDSYYEMAAKKSAYIEADLKDGSKCYGITIAWMKEPVGYAVSVPDGNSWKIVATSNNPNGFIYEYLPLDGLDRFRITPVDHKKKMQISELTLYSEGELPQDVQRWKPTPDKADLMVLVAHPDDEFIFMGGTIPYYALERGKTVTVVYLSKPTIRRQKELLKGLWTAGVRTYPVMGPFEDKYQTSLSKTYSHWKKAKVLAFVKEAFDLYSPEVVITHDIKGEYGHGAHRVAADAAIQVLAQGDSPVKKLYIHLYKENALRMDWNTAYESMDGKTPLEVAQAAYAHHRSQHGGKVTYKGRTFEFQVVDGGMFDNASFGLYYSTVGSDIEKNDFFENIQ